MMYTSFQKFIFIIRSETIKSAIVATKALFKVECAVFILVIISYEYVNDLEYQNITRNMDWALKK